MIASAVIFLISAAGPFGHEVGPFSCQIDKVVLPRNLHHSSSTVTRCIPHTENPRVDKILSRSIEIIPDFTPYFAIGTGFSFVCYSGTAAHRMIEPVFMPAHPVLQELTAEKAEQGAAANP